MKTLMLILILLVLVSGCTQSSNQSSTDTQSIILSCVELCKSVKPTKDLSNGPCLSDNLLQSHVVCDVVHSPRQAVDDLPENQCQEYREGRANQFIEVDTDCNFIRAN